jgi:hypothetical protein
VVTGGSLLPAFNSGKLLIISKQMGGEPNTSATAFEQLFNTF